VPGQRRDISKLPVHALETLHNRHCPRYSNAKPAKRSDLLTFFSRLLAGLSGPVPWLEVLPHPRASGYYTAEDLDALFDEDSALLAKYGHGRHDAPPGARLMQLRMFYIPEESRNRHPSA